MNEKRLPKDQTVKGSLFSSGKIVRVMKQEFIPRTALA